MENAHTSSLDQFAQAHLRPGEFRSVDEAFRLMQEGVQDYAMFFVATDGTILSWNIGVQHVLGYTQEEFVGRRSSFLFPPEEGGTARGAQEMEVAATEGRCLDVGWHLRADGGRVWASGIMSALHDEQGTLRGYAKVMSDETEKLRLQQEREELLERERQARLAAETAQRDAEDANRAKDYFITVVTHELRAPLTVILGWADLLRGQEMSEEMRGQGLDTIERNAQSMSRLVEDLLDVSRVREGRINLEMGTVDLARIVEQGLEEIRPVAVAKNIYCCIQNICHASVLADAERLNQILRNLLSNAVKFTPEGGEISLSLQTAQNSNGNCARLSIRDNGQGIAPDFLPHVFDRFQQQTRAAGGGLGLGLSIVKALVDQHGGTISAHSDGIGKGAEFVLELPLASAN
ncbi:MAG TPA: PAS domain-containing sensor histidine kinase [Abditibacteriaceae bacterium]|jgi:PAS domain S-box-containing protein